MHHADDVRLTPGTHTLRGSCRCGAIRFEADLDLMASGTTRCNCTWCTKTGWWGVLTKPASFRLLQGEDRLVPSAAKQFFPRKRCADCGVEAFSQGDLDFLGGPFVAINVRCFDGVDLTGVPVRYLDGLHDTWTELRTAPYASGFRA